MGKGLIREIRTNKELFKVPQTFPAHRPINQDESNRNAQEFAMKIGVSRSTLMEHLKELREMGAPIGYCNFRETYYYTEESNWKWSSLL